MQDQIKATVIADSINPNGVRITTLEIEYPRFIHCFDDETEVLCKVGTNTPTFLLFKEAIEQDAMVAQYSKDDGSVMFVKPNAWIVNEHSGKMISLENHQRINFCVTDEHRMFVGSRKRNGDLKEIILAKELLGDFTQKRFYKSGSNASAVKMNPDLLKLVAFFIADGYLPKYGNQAIFHLKKERKIKEISRILKNISVDHDIRKYQDGCTNVVLNRLPWMDLCYNSAGEKVLPAQFFNMDTESFQAFKQGLLESDGCVANNEYNTFSEEYIDQLQALFTVNNSSFNKKKYKDCFKVKFLVEDEPILRRDKHNVEEIEYNGKVYCASVDTGLLFVRRKGIVHISGNCEFMTHRVFSRNSASSRAIPVSKMVEQVRNNPAIPVHWGKNQAGMQANEELSEEKKSEALTAWLHAAQDAADNAEHMRALGLHKQVVNRILEPFQIMKVVVTSTEWENFFWLRDHKDAQPEIRVLAQKMKQAMQESDPIELEYGMWHLPYVKQIFGGGSQVCYNEHGNVISIDDAIKISCSSCAQVSYRKLDTSLEKAEDLYDKLVNSEPVHASAFEHVALCLSNFEPSEGWTHEETNRPYWEDIGQRWSGNFRGWIQYRQIIPGNARKG